MLHSIITTCTRVVVILAAVLMSAGLASAQHDVDDDHQVVVTRVQVPDNAQLRALLQIALHREVQALKVAVQRHTLTVSHVSWSADNVVMIGHRLRRHIDSARSTLWLEEVRVSVPLQHLTNAWDVRSLQKELERLGIKIKPKPTSPKPTQSISG